MAMSSLFSTDLGKLNKDVLTKVHKLSLLQLNPTNPIPATTLAIDWSYFLTTTIIWNTSNQQFY